MRPELRGYPIDYDQLHRSRQERAIRKSRNGARNQSRRPLALWRKR
ncbi:MAG TPA: hypothetical protein VM282_02245 [Acidimicrobiales bacterium]|nr:hypothetical protein [Acidimicrobiales bacterium]